MREAERRLGLSETLAGCIREWRDPERVVHALQAMLRFRMFAIACGYEDADDCDALRGDPLFKLAVGRAPESGRDLCSQPTMSRLENAPSRVEVARMTAALVDIFCRSFPAPPAAIMLDIDDTCDAVHGRQQLSLFNAHYDTRCFLPVHVYHVESGKPVSVLLRPGKTPSGAEVRTLLKHLVRRIRQHWPRTRLTVVKRARLTPLNRSESTCYHADRRPICGLNNSVGPISACGPARRSRSPGFRCGSGRSRSTCTLRASRACPSMKLHRDLEVTQKTAWFMLHRLREAWAESGIEQFSGPVEADETYIGGKRKNMPKSKRAKLTGRGSVGKTAVVGTKDRATNRVSARSTAETDTPALSRFVADRTEPGAKVFTDESKAYSALDASYDHESVNHSAGEYVRGEAHTNGMESFWAMFKRGYQGTYHHMSAKHLDRYVSEFSGRHNVRERDTIDQMGDLVAQMVGKRSRTAT